MAEEKKVSKQDSGQPEGRKINPWIPVAIVAVIVALIAVMAAIGNNNSATTTTDQAASGTTPAGTTATQTDVDVSWITLDITPNDVATKTGISPKMLQQVLGVQAEQMAKPFKDIGGQAVLDKAASLVVQFGGQGGAMGGATGGSTSAPSGMGGTTTSP